MKALLLSAGYGTRLGTLTKNKPKPMIEVAGKPIIEHIMTRLHIHGIHQIIINLHYLPEVLTNYIKDQALYYYEPRLLGHKKTILALKEWLKDDDFFVINADTISEVNFTDMKQSHIPKTITVHMDEWRCCGTWIYPKEYFYNQELSVIPYRDNNVWFDIGDPVRLQTARDYYEITNKKDR